MRKFLLTAVVLSSSFAGSAMAADLGTPVRAPVYAPAPLPVVAAYTWTGCYVGGNGGGIWARRDWSDPVFSLGDFGTQTASGGLGGLQAGCNYQRGHWVFGVQGDWDWASATNSNLNTIFPRFTDQSDTKSLASLTLRAGYAWDRYLLYVKGGGAWIKTDFSLQGPFGVSPTVSETRSGWTVGVGLEYAFLDWLTGFVEGDYYGIRDNDTIGLPCGFGCPITSTTTLPVSLTTNVRVVKAGVNFKFGPNTRW
jgi:outer membrane immunogenic protein